MLVVVNSCVRTTMMRHCSITTGHLRRSALPRRRSVVSSPTSRAPLDQQQRQQLGTAASARNTNNNNNNGRRRGKLRETAEYEAFCRQQQQQLQGQPAGGGVNNTKKSMPAPGNKEQHWEPWEPIVYFGILPIVIWCGIIYFSPELRAQMYEHMEWQQPPDTVIAAETSRNDTDTDTAATVAGAATDASTSE
jgi:hypothetical protein